jgi:hypothetical protein
VALGKATETVELQKPLLRPHFQQIDTCKIGTINLALTVPLQVRLPDIVTPPLDWHPGYPAGEKFGITRIEIELSDGIHHEAWIYTAEFSPHRFKHNVAEVLAKPLNGIAKGARCRIHIERALPMLVI